MVCTILNLAYSKEHVYYMLLTYSMTLFFLNQQFITWDIVVDCDNYTI